MKTDFKTGSDFAGQDLVQDIIDSKGIDGEVTKFEKVKNNDRYIIYYITYEGRECQYSISSQRELINFCEKFGYDFNDLIEDLNK